MTLRVRTAQPADAGAVLAVLDSAAAWLGQRGIEQWPARFAASSVRPALDAGRVWIAEVGGTPVATLTLEWSDPLWPDDAMAGYVHRFAVSRSRRPAGLGRLLLDRVDRVVRTHGREYVRLDCAASNARLRRYYQEAGFGHRGDVEVPGAPHLLVSRYERAVTA